MGAQKTHEQFNQEIKEKYNDEFILLSKYTGSKETISVQHNTEHCQFPFEITAKRLLKSGNCKKCVGKRDWTHELFTKEVTALTNGEYEVQTEFVDTQTAIIMKHTIEECQHEWPVKPNEFLGSKNRKGTRCPQCFGNHVLTTAIFKKRVYDVTKDHYTVLGEYKNNRTKIMMKHNRCKDGKSYEFPMKPNGFLNGQRCPKCAGNIKKTTNQFKEEVRHLVGEEYTVLGEYIRSSEPIKMYHAICKRPIDVYPNDFVNKAVRCRHCQHEKTGNLLRKTHEQFEREFTSLVSDEYELRGAYRGNKARIKVFHAICQKESFIHPNSFMDGGHRCRHCAILSRADKARKKTEDFIQEVFELVGDEYEVTGEYRGNKQKISMIHHTCKETFYPTPNNFLGKESRCPHCQESKGERKIRMYLTKKQLSFQSQYSINECRYKNPLPFDFAVFHQDKLVFLIEYQGEQHYKPVALFGGEENLKATQMRDGIKAEYCAKNNIPLLCIPYTEYKNVEKILRQELLKRT